jgi:hypothetical protein
MNSRAQRPRRRRRGRFPSGLVLVIGAALLSLAPPAEAADPAQSLVPERNALLLKLLRNEDPRATTAAIRQLYEQRARLLTSAAQTAEQGKKRQAELEIYQKSLDYEAAWYCRLAVDPRAPRADGHPSLDFGRVVRKTEVAIDGPRDNPLADSSVTLFEVAGQSERYIVDGSDNPSFQAAVGDLVALCRHKQRIRSDLAAPWNTVKLTSSQYSGRIARPPRIVDKAAWNPLHITDSELRNAILWKRWETPPDRLVVALVRVEKDLGAGRYAMLSRYWQDPFVLEVPVGLPRRELLQPGEFLWIILGKPRFDRDLQKLVLTAIDLELRYLVEP